MQVKEFYRLIGLSDAARRRAEAVERKDPSLFRAPLIEDLFLPDRREEGLKALAALVGEDSDGMKTFVYMSHCCAERTHEMYLARGIGEDIFCDTMKFLSRFLASEYEKTGQTAFRWGWWFPRQISMSEFRIGQLEYEMLPDGNIAMHIPGDACLKAKDVGASVRRARVFFERYFPAYGTAVMTCDSWLLSPALQGLLPQTSNILQFQSNFRLTGWDENSPAFLEWVYPDKDTPIAELPEGTHLQRAMKEYLLSGGKIGWARGELKKDAYCAE